MNSINDVQSENDQRNSDFEVRGRLIALSVFALQGRWVVWEDTLER